MFQPFANKKKIIKYTLKFALFPFVSLIVNLIAPVQRVACVRFRFEVVLCKTFGMQKILQP